MKVHVGVYAKSQYGSLVRVSSETDGGDRGPVYGVDYVQIVGGQVLGGGSSFWYEPSHFVPLTDPVDILAAQAFEAARLKRVAEAEVKKQAYEERVALSALAACRSALEQAKAVGAVDPVDEIVAGGPLAKESV